MAGKMITLVIPTVGCVIFFVEPMLGWFATWGILSPVTPLIPWLHHPRGANIQFSFHWASGANIHRRLGLRKKQKNRAGIAKNQVGWLPCCFTSEGKQLVSGRKHTREVVQMADLLEVKGLDSQKHLPYFGIARNHCMDCAPKMRELHEDDFRGKGSGICPAPSLWVRVSFK